MRVVLFGPPASGKGSQAYLLKDALGVPHLSTGDLLRRVAQEDSVWGEKVRAVPVGHFASDDLIVALLQAELEKPEYNNGVLLDGFPRTQAQAQTMHDMGLNMDVAIHFCVDEEVLTQRLVNRRVHPQSGRIYNLLTRPPHQEGVDDVTGEPLVHRDDDRLEVVQQRFEDYRNKTLPAVEWFRRSGIRWIDVDGTQDSEVVFDTIINQLKPTLRAKNAF